ncbi:ABC transporter substrate-binding protein [Xylanimonas sp. McL0601]|uniref:ABC transporter substrate-binding protein n=1 Tax=Xylanimonas sp. McL0601 TaxID=3414739 RepID=UPI003CF2B1DA
MATAVSAPGRRTAVAAAAAAVFALTLAGCSSDGDDAAANADPESTDLSGTITYAVWDQTQVDGIQKNIDAFNVEHPDVTVNVDVTPWADYWTKRQTEASSNTLPDVLWMNGPNFQLYASNDKLEPITKLVDSGAIDPSKYPSALVDLYSLDGVSYGMPKDFDTIGIWANKALFDEAGVALPEGDWTWEQFQETAAKISTALKDKGIYGAAAGMDGQTTYYPTIFQAGGSVIDNGKSGYNSPESQAGLQFWADLIASGASPTIPQLTDQSADQWFLSGKLAMYQGGSWYRAALTDADFKDDIRALPLPKGKEQANVIHGVANVVSANSKNKAAAQAFQAFLASEQAQKTQAESGIISAYEGTQDTFLAALPNAGLQVFLDATKYAKPLPVSANTAAWNAIETELLPAAFSGERPVADVTADVAKQMDAALAAE